MRCAHELRLTFVPAVTEMEHTELPPKLATNMVPVGGCTVMPHSSVLKPVAQLGLTTVSHRQLPHYKTTTGIAHQELV